MIGRYMGRGHGEGYAYLVIEHRRDDTHSSGAWYSNPLSELVTSKAEIYPGPPWYVAGLVLLALRYRMLSTKVVLEILDGSFDF